MTDDRNERRQSTVDGGRRLLERLERDRRDQRADLERQRREGELVARGSVRRLPRAPLPAPSREESVRQYWRWAAMVYDNGIPPGWTAAERPEGV